MERCSIRRLQDSYTDGGRDDGGPLAPPVVVPPDAEAGGRSTNGKVWVEHLADDAGATLMDYAVSSLRVYPCRRYRGRFVETCLLPIAIRRGDGFESLAERNQEGRLSWAK